MVAEATAVTTADTDITVGTGGITDTAVETTEIITIGTGDTEAATEVTDIDGTITTTEETIITVTREEDIATDITTVSGAEKEDTPATTTTRTEDTGTMDIETFTIKKIQPITVGTTTTTMMEITGGGTTTTIGITIGMVEAQGTEPTTDSTTAGTVTEMTTTGTEEVIIGIIAADTVPADMNITVIMDSTDIMEEDITEVANTTTEAIIITRVTTDPDVVTTTKAFLSIGAGSCLAELNPSFVSRITVPLVSFIDVSCFPC